MNTCSFLFFNVSLVCISLKIPLVTVPLLHMEKVCVELNYWFNVYLLT